VQIDPCSLPAMTLKNNVDTNAAPGDESDVSVPVSPASVAGPETNEASSEDDAKGLPVAKPDGDESSSTGATGEADEFPALDVCVASMTEAEQRDWEQAKALFQDPANALAAESLDHEMITRQVRGKHFIKKDKQRWKVRLFILFCLSLPYSISCCPVCILLGHLLFRALYPIPNHAPPAFAWPPCRLW
jgi:hypothetical protein